MISDDVRIGDYSIKGLLHGIKKEFFGPCIVRKNNGFIIFCFMIANQMVGNVYTFLQSDFVNTFFVNSNIHYEELLKQYSQMLPDVALGVKSRVLLRGQAVKQVLNGFYEFSCVGTECIMKDCKLIDKAVFKDNQYDRDCYMIRYNITKQYTFYGCPFSSGSEDIGLRVYDNQS